MNQFVVAGGIELGVRVHLSARVPVAIMSYCYHLTYLVHVAVTVY